MKIFDAHSHWLPPEIRAHASFFNPLWSDLDAQVKVMDETGIEKALLTYPTTDAHLKMAGGWGRLACTFNDDMAATIKKYPGRFIGSFIIPFGEKYFVNEECFRAHQRLGLAVLSLPSSYNGMYLDNESLFYVYDYCQAEKIPVFIHSQISGPIGSERVNDPLLSPVMEYVFDLSMCAGKLMMSGVFNKFPGLKFVFAHFGGVLPFLKERFDTTYEMLRGVNYVKDLGAKPSDILRQVYLDMSGCKSASVLKCALEMTDPGHILFGSDWPANQDLPGAIGLILNSGLSETDQERILSKNFDEVVRR